MREHRGPHDSAKCPFYVQPDDPCSAGPSIDHCVQCVTDGYPRLKQLCEDFRQTAFVTILEETPAYNPDHPSGASFITFMKSKVCCSLWRHRHEELKYIPCDPDEEADEEDRGNPLVEDLRAAACTCDTLEDAAVWHLDTEAFRTCLPELMERLTPKERTVVTMKFYDEATGREIAAVLGVSKGRVSQLMKAALAKLKTAFLRKRTA